MSSLSRFLNPLPPRSVSPPPMTRWRSCFGESDIVFPWVAAVNRSLGELGHAVADEPQDGPMAGGTGCDQCTMHDVRAVEAERAAGEVGHEAAGFVHQKMCSRKVPVVAAAGGKRSVQNAFADLRQAQRQRVHLGLRQGRRGEALQLLKVPFRTGDPGPGEIVA